MRLILSLPPGVLLHTAGPYDPLGSVTPSLKQRRGLGSVSELLNRKRGVCCLDPNLRRQVSALNVNPACCNHARYTAHDLL